MTTLAAAKPGKLLNIALWIAQVVLAAFYAMVGSMKVSKSIPELATAMHWPGLVPEALVRFVGTAELAGAIGLILPMLTGIMPRLTALAAAGLMVLQICAMIFHISQGEAQVLPMNLVLFAIPTFILWGRRFKKV